MGLINIFNNIRNKEDIFFSNFSKKIKNRFKMADGKIDKSLDDIIKERKISGRTPRANGAGGKPGGRGAGRGAARGGLRRGTSSNAAANRSFGRRPNGMVQKRRSAGGSPLKGSNINGQWGHDLFQGRRSAGANGRADMGQAKLVISNLDFGVNDQDIKGLFQEFGNIKKAAVHYDRSGRSLGTADVLFERKPDAIKALKKYNGVSLDGRPMDIKLTAGIEQTVAQIAPRLSGGNGNGNGFRRGGNRGGRGGNRGGAKTPREKKPERTAADLDADLDTYNSKMQTD